MENYLVMFFGNWFGSFAWEIIKALSLIVSLTISVAYLTLAERRILAFMHARVGANRVGYRGVLQPFADLLKFLLKEIIVPTKSYRYIFYMAPVVLLVSSLSVWAVIPINETYIYSNINVGVLYVMALSSLGVYGIVLAGWASNSKYAFLGGIRATAQMISYELAMGFSLIGVVMIAGSLNFIDIVHSQVGAFHGSILSWNFIPLFPLFLIYLISGLAETNRAPFDVCEGESELVAGFHVEYSGAPFALFMLAEYANMVLIAIMTSIMFLGGWLSPFPQTWGVLGMAFPAWLFAKTICILFLFIWFRATFPRYRYDQIMRLGWKVFLPISLFWIYVESLVTTV